MYHTNINVPLIKKRNKNELKYKGVYDCNDGRSIFLQCGVILKLVFPLLFSVAFFFFLKQHHLFWNTEWQYLLWREANTPQSHGLTGSNPFCGDAPLFSAEDPASWICSALFRNAVTRNPDEHLCQPLLFHHFLSRTMFKRINKSRRIPKLPDASHYFPP